MLQDRFSMGRQGMCKSTASRAYRYALGCLYGHALMRRILDFEREASDADARSKVKVREKPAVWVHETQT